MTSSSEEEYECESEDECESEPSGPAIKKFKPNLQLLRTRNGHGLRPRKAKATGIGLHTICKKRRPRKIYANKQGRKIRRVPLKNSKLMSGRRPFSAKLSRRLTNHSHQQVKKSTKKKIPKNKRWKRSDFCKMSKVVGEGTFGRIYIVSCKEFDQKFAIKTLKRLAGLKITKEANLEAKIQKRADHVNIVKCFGTLTLNRRLGLVLEFCPMGNLFDFVEKTLHSSGKSATVIEKRVKSIVRQIVSGIDYAQNKLGYIHMDLKLDNVLLFDHLIVKVADFGCAVRMKSPRQKHFEDDYVGGVPPSYCPPELLKSRGFFFDSTMDVWSIGCLTYKMLTKCDPFFKSYNTRQEKACVKNALQIIRNVHRGKFQIKFIERLGSYKNVLTFLRHIFVPRTSRPLIRNLLELDWLN